MPPRRWIPTRSRSTPFAEPERQELGQDQQREVQELRAQVAQLSEAVRHQEVAMDFMRRLVEQRIQPVMAPSEVSPAPYLPTEVPPTASRVPVTPALPIIRGSAPRIFMLEPGAVVMMERTLAPGEITGAKRPMPEDFGQSSRQAPPRPPRYHPQGRGPQGRQWSGGSRPRQHRQQQRRQRRRQSQQQPQQQRRQDRCVICSGPHLPSACSQRQDRCYRCGQFGHFQSSCLRAPYPAQSSASVPLIPLPMTGPPSSYSMPGRTPSSKQFEWRPPVPSGSVDAAPVEDAVAAGHVVAEASPSLPTASAVAPTDRGKGVAS